MRRRDRDRDATDHARDRTAVVADGRKKTCSPKFGTRNGNIRRPPVGQRADPKQG